MNPRIVNKGLFRRIFEEFFSLHLSISSIFRISATIGISILLSTQAFSANDSEKYQTKLDTATQFVSDFLIRDAAPSEVFFHRDVEFPVGKGYPTTDCGVLSLVRSIEQRGRPRFADSTQRVVEVPVVAELVFIWAGQAGGPDVRPDIDEGHGWCSFEYERYNFKTQKFERLPDFRKHTLNIEFKSWGEVLPVWRSAPIPKGLEDDRYVAVDIDKRYVRYQIRVDVSQGKPYRVWPQVPRHWLATDGAKKINRIIERKIDLLQRGISDRDPRATGDALTRDLERMRNQLEQEQWMLKMINQRLDSLKPTEPFSDLRQDN